MRQSLSGSQMERFVGYGVQSGMPYLGQRCLHAEICVAENDSETFHFIIRICLCSGSQTAVLNTVVTACI